MERKYHVVKQGETKESIRLQYGVSSVNFDKWNPDSGTVFVGGTITGTWTNDQGTEFNWSITEVSEGHWLDDNNANRTYTQAQIDDIQTQSSQSNIVYDAGTMVEGGLAIGDRVWTEGEYKYVYINSDINVTTGFDSDLRNYFVNYFTNYIETKDPNYGVGTEPVTVNVVFDSNWVTAPTIISTGHYEAFVSNRYWIPNGEYAVSVPSSASSEENYADTWNTEMEALGYTTTQPVLNTIQVNAEVTEYVINGGEETGVVDWSRKGIVLLDMSGFNGHLGRWVSLQRGRIGPGPVFTYIYTTRTGSSGSQEVSNAAQALINSPLLETTIYGITGGRHGLISDLINNKGWRFGVNQYWLYKTL